jgi:hypothetical protein
MGTDLLKHERKLIFLNINTHKSKYYVLQGNVEVHDMHETIVDVLRGRGHTCLLGSP